MSQKSAIKKTIGYILLLISFVFPAIVIKYTKSCDCVTSLIFKELTLDTTNPESKWILIRDIFLKLATFVFIHMCFVMFCRIFLGKSSPATQKDPIIIKLVNRIITNTIEQSFIFLGLFIYLLTEGPGDKLAPALILNLAAWFILSRPLFSIGYIVGTIIGLPQLRGMGIALGVVVQVMLVDYIFSKTPIIAPHLLAL